MFYLFSFYICKVLGLEEQHSSKACAYSMAKFLSSNPQIKPPHRNSKCNVLKCKWSVQCEHIKNPNFVEFSLGYFQPPQFYSFSFSTMFKSINQVVLLFLFNPTAMNYILISNFSVWSSNYFICQLSWTFYITYHFSVVYVHTV